MIDSHTHLDSCAPDDKELVREAEQAGVRKLLTVGTDSASCRAALAAAEAFPQVYAAIGRHPNWASGFDDADLDRALASLAAGLRVVAQQLMPFMPETMGRLATAVEGDELEALEPLFPKREQAEREVAAPQ